MLCAAHVPVVSAVTHDFRHGRRLGDEGYNLRKEWNLAEPRNASSVWLF
jgi:hypothetical protein